ncbi:MAG: hypothetical protein QOJ23_3207 [Actinomycetota bacterium]|jgi:hypothetical protein|nr:hypothetical protein [Actinomycetota bacterium]
MTELAGQGSYRQLAEEIGTVLQAAAETAEKMQDDARAQAARVRDEAEEQLRTACTEARRILDEARMEADMVRAEAEWQSQEIIAQARRTAAEHLAGADTRLADVEQAESRVIDRLAGVGQVLAESLAALRRPADTKAAAAPTGADTAEAAPDDTDSPTAKVYFVEFPPMAQPIPETGDPAPTDTEIVLSDSPGASLFADDGERSEWAPPSEDLPAWWTRGGAQG